MIVSIEGNLLNNKKVAYIEKINDNKFVVYFTGGRSLSFTMPLNDFFKSAFLSKKDFIKWKNLYLYTKNVDILSPFSNESETLFFAGSAGRYMDLSEKEHARLTEAVKKAQNWTVALRR